MRMVKRPYSPFIVLKGRQIRNSILEEERFITRKEEMDEGACSSFILKGYHGRNGRDRMFFSLYKA